MTRTTTSASIEQAIVSTLEQDFPAADREIIVMENDPTDRTPEIVKKFLLNWSEAA